MKKKQNENAEWKARVEKQDSDILFLKHLTERQRDRLTKATELIEDMYDAIPSSHSDYYKDVMERAIEFLKEDE